MSRQKNYKKNISYSLYKDLKENILNLKYKPGQILLEDEIAKIYNVSRTPIREALKDLKNDGFLELNNGNRVSKLSLNSYMMIFQMRENLELMSVKLATLNWDDNTIKLLEDNVSKQKKLIYKKKYEPISFLDLDRAFHSILCEIGGNYYLHKDLLKYYDLYYRYNFFCGFKTRKDYAIVEHENLLTMIKTRNVNLSENDMKEHMRNVNNQIIINLANKLSEFNNK